MIKIFLFLLLNIHFVYSSPLCVSWDDFEKGEDLHVNCQLEKAFFREPRPYDKEFYQTLLTHPDVCRTMGNGSINNLEDIAFRHEKWIKNFSSGIPYGHFLVQSEENSVGCCTLCPNDTPGVGEIVRAILPEFQGMGLGKECLHFLVDIWGPYLRAEGLGQNRDASHPIVQKFRLFESKPLRLIYTTSRPSNRASWEGYKHFGFQPAQTDFSEELTCEQWEESQHGPFEEFILSKHFSDSSYCLPDTRYPLTDERGILRTISFVSEYESLRYHFEKSLE